VVELMAEFRYLAYDGAGHRVNGALEAASADQVKQQLWTDGLYIVSVRAKRFSLPSAAELFPSVFRVRRSEVILFTRELATFVRVGISILDGLTVLRDQASSRRMRSALDEMITSISTGSSLSGAMARQPTIFSALYVDMIRSAEVSGNLDDTLRQLATYMARDESSLRKLRSAMVYPCVVLALAAIVITVLLVFVLPAFVSLFHDFRAGLPLVTRILLTIGSATSSHAHLLLAVIAVLIGGPIAITRAEWGRARWDALVLRIPMVGTVVRYGIVERYLRTMATLARSGVPIGQMLQTATQSVGNRVYARALREVRPQMLSGDGIAAPLSRTGLFPRLVIQMIKVGEETGNLDGNLEQAADHFGEEMDFRLKRMVAVLEPAMVIVVGVIVGFIAVSVIAPMYALVSAVK
jgi:type IV pilus assembly protein PilC